MNQLNTYSVVDFKTERGVQCEKLNTSYQRFGLPLHTAPIVLINHALTGNSTVTGHSGWWNQIVGDNKVIDTTKYTILSIDVLGNGFNGELIENYKDFSAKDIAKLFFEVLKHLKVNHLFACVGGSIGGGIGWELAILKPELIKFLIPVASHWQSSDWIIAHNFVQDNILNNSNTPLENARQMAMLFYRTPKSFTQKFNHGKEDDSGLYKVESWLNYHGKALDKRFKLQAYKMMNHLLTTINITTGKKSFKDAVKDLKSTVIQIGIDSDLFFKADDNKQTKVELDKIGVKNEYHEIKSIHGHDAFLIEHNQLTQILKPIFSARY